MTIHESSRRQKGAILLESLVAVLLLSLGILGLIGVQTLAITTANDSKYRADASYLANQIIGQMWADRALLAAYQHRSTTGGTCTFTGTDSTNANVTSWLTRVAASLPDATSARQQITVDANNIVSVTICWVAPQDNRTHNFVAVAQING